MSDSDTDSEPSVPVKRRRATTSVVSLATEAAPALTKSSSRYLDEVKTYHGEQPEQLSADSDVEEEVKTLTKEKSGRAARQRKPCNKENVNASTAPPNEEEEDVAVLDVSLNTSNGPREPTPPPTPPSNSNFRGRGRRRRTPKAIKTAISNLSSLQTKMRIGHVISTLNDSLNTSSLENDVICLDDSPEKAIPVRVSCGKVVHRFTLQRNQTFSPIFKAVAREIEVNEEQILMFLRDQMVEPYDTPAVLDLHIADIIECHVRPAEDVAAARQAALDLDDPNVIQIAVQGKDTKSKLTLPVHQREPLERILKAYAREFKLNYSELQFRFDGEVLDAQESAASLDMEDDDCIDVS